MESPTFWGFMTHPLISFHMSPCPLFVLCFAQLELEVFPGCSHLLIPPPPSRSSMWVGIFSRKPIIGGAFRSVNCLLVSFVIMTIDGHYLDPGFH